MSALVYCNSDIENLLDNNENISNGKLISICVYDIIKYQYLKQLEPFMTSTTYSGGYKRLGGLH